MVSVSLLYTLLACCCPDTVYFGLNLVMGGYIWDSPLQFYMAYVVGLFCYYIPWSLVMVSVLCLVLLVPCCGSDVGYFGLDLVIGGIFVVIPWQFCWPISWGLFCCYVPWSRVMVSMLCLMVLLPCCGSDV